MVLKDFAPPKNSLKQYIAEWRSWSSRLAHNQEVAQSGSNPASATKF